MLAHGAGLDDLLVIVAILGAFLLLPGRGRLGPATDDGVCAYCGMELEGAERCSACGFRAAGSGGSEP